MVFSFSSAQLSYLKARRAYLNARREARSVEWAAEEARERIDWARRHACRVGIRRVRALFRVLKKAKCKADTLHLVLRLRRLALPIDPAKGVRVFKDFVHKPKVTLVDGVLRVKLPRLTPGQQRSLRLWGRWR